MKRPVVLVLGPHRGAVSGVSTHLNFLLASRLAEEFSLVHFQVGSEGRTERRIGRLARLVVSPFSLATAILVRGAAIVHLNTSLNTRAYWRDLAYMIVAKICGARVLYQVHGGALPQEFFRGSRALSAFLRETLQLADVIVVLAQREAVAYRKFVRGQQVLALPHGIDCSPYAVCVHPRSDAAAPLRLVYIGRLAREKGLFETLLAMKIAHAHGTRARLVIAGSGPEEARLRQLAGELGLARHVSFIGPVFGEHKTRLLGEADVLVLASYSEGLPYAVLEAMAAGAPVIATRVGAIPEVVLEGVHGLFVPPRDPEGIARAISSFASDRDLLARMSAACRMRIAGAYSMERLSGQFCGVYAELCAAKRVRVLTRS